MKKILLFASALAGLFLAGSCQRENLEPVQSANTVTYTVTVPDALATKGIGDDVSNVNTLHYEVYRTAVANTTTFTDADRLLYHKTATVTNGTAKIELELVNDQNFTVLFWAQVEKDDFTSPYVVGDLRNVSIKDPSVLSLGNALKANQIDYAAFSGVDFIKATEALADKNVSLTRPVAQLNLATTYESLSAFNTPVKLEGSYVKVSGLSKTFDVATQMASADDFNTVYEYTEQNVPDGALVVANKEYKYAGMNYVGFAAYAGTPVTVKYILNTTEGNIENTIENVPVKPNFRTNIIGNLITSKTAYTIKLDETWGTPEEVVDLWDGTSMKQPAYDETTETYSISVPSEIAWLAAAVNGTLPETKAAVPADSFSGKTFILTKDINLNDQAWTPIGNSTNKFQGTFDGNGKTIKNLCIIGTDNYVGLFGFTTDGTIKNLTIENAKVSGRVGVGVVAGSPYTSKFENITVKGHVEVNGMSYVGGVGGRNAYANWSNITVNVDETSYVNANSVENGIAYRTYVGGVVGFNGEGGHSFKNIRSNIDVKGSTIDVGGLFGIAHYGNQFENCSCSGNVEIYAAEDADAAEEIGGIAGVWMDSVEGNVTFTNVSFTGEVTTNIERETIWYGNLFGKPYNNNGKGKLIVDGIEMIANGVGMMDGEYYVTSAQGLVWVEAQADNFFAGKTIKLANDIDMTGVAIANPIKFWNGRTTFDGQNYTISNLTMSTSSTEKKPFSLFSGTADIKNVKFNNANISGYSYVAVVAGNLYGNIDNCHVSNSSVTCTYWMAGALSGQYNNGNVTNCTVTNTTVTGPAAVGALVGNINETAGERKVENCTVTGCTIAQNGSFGGDYDKMFAAAVGLININNSKVYFTNCTIENTTVKGTESTDLFGLNGCDETIVYVNGDEFVTNGVTKDSEGNFLISSAAGLKWVSNVVNATTPYTATLFDGKTVKLMNDIDLKNEEWIPIGDDRSQRTEFHGVFDGQGHTVKNVKITKKTDRDDENKSSYGLFGNLKGTVKNLTVENVSISGAPKFIGALVGRMNDGLIENCHVKNSSVECNDWTIGGLVGQLNNGKISGCTVEDTAIKGYAAVGAIAGIALSEGERVIENCSVKNCTILQNGSFGYGNYDEMFGAIVGALYSGTLTVYLNACSVENTEIKGVASTELCGFISEGGKLVVNGYEILAPGLGYNETSKTYAVSSAEGLVAMSNTTIKAGESVVLTADIDLAGVEFNGLNAFNSENNNTFDGQGHTVSNWTYTGKADDMGFIKNWGGPIMNLTIKNAVLRTGGRSAVIVAKPYGNIVNCHVENCNLQANYWACGLITGMHNSGNMENCSAKNSYIKSTGGTGAITGVLNETSGSRTYKGCIVEGCTINNGGTDPYAGAAILGLINIDNATVTFDGCAKSSNTYEGTAKDEFYGYNAGDNTTVTIK